MSDTWAIAARRKINDDFDEALEYLVEWKRVELAIRDVIESLGTNEELDALHKEQKVLYLRMTAHVEGLYE